ncbi:MAG: V-type ATPase subunit, partial [Candidatus Aenigmarchaeota archaeon]|nr:V-type ATPase subunit [Candidatus Aenigmarchaeota archaeon]
KEELISHLEDTTYEALFATKDIDEVEDNLNNALIKTLNKVTGFLPKRYSDDFNRYLIRFDLQNLKLIIRGLSADIPIQKIKKDLTRYGAIYNTPETVKDLNTLENSLEGTPWYQAYKEGLTNYKKTQKISDLEHELDKRYMSELEKITTQPIQNFVKLYKQMIDQKTISRLGKDHAKPYLFSKDTAKNTPQKTLETHARQSLMADPFGIGLYIEFMFRKEMETRLIKSVLRSVWK